MGGEDCRYITRPAIANERLMRSNEGQVVLQMKSAYRDGSTHIVTSAWEFIQRGPPCCRARACT